MSITVTGLCERFIAESTLERHVLVVYAQMVTEVAQFWELQGTLLALKDLVHALGLYVQAMKDVVIPLVLDLLIASSHYGVLTLCVRASFSYPLGVLVYRVALS